MPAASQQATADQPASVSPPSNNQSPTGAESQHTATISSDAPPAEPEPTYVAISDGKKLNVPSLVGLPIRAVIEMTAAQGLQVQITGSGTVREQAPAPGTKVPSGTKVVVRCGR